MYNSHIPFAKDKIYFLFIDRFHDGKLRDSQFSNIRKKGYGEINELKTFYGGNLRGVLEKLPYIKKMGFTAIWLSPFFQNTNDQYHGYAIKDFTAVDTHFGSTIDLKNLIQKAHELHLKVYMDVIINHIGNLFSYQGNHRHIYNNSTSYSFGKWHYKKYPQPVQLQNPNFYEKKGAIQNWDQYPELMLGDFFELKKFKLDETEVSLELQNHLVDIYAYWIKNYDFDGFRIDTARHMSPLVLSRFSHKIKQFAKSLGKQEFPIFIEAPFIKDEQLLAYFKTNIDKDGNVYDPPDGFLDFFIHIDLPQYFKNEQFAISIIKHMKSIENLRKMADSPMHQITFLDNHDQVGELFKQRISNKLTNYEIIKAWETLLQLQTIPTLYYGTEQGLSGQGYQDTFVRESMFDKHSNQDVFDTEYVTYKKIRNLNNRYK